MRILIAAGGTGGHIFPAISLADKIRQMDPSANIIFCVDGRVDKRLLDKSNYRYYLLNAPRMPYKISLKWISFLTILMFSFAKPGKILDEVNPDVVVGFGAYITGPLITQAKRRNKKIIIHEQNITMGRANRILSKIADKIAISFDNPSYTKDDRYLLTGNPIREVLIEDLGALNRERAHRLLGLDAGKKTILVMGGSLGSLAINTTFLKMIRNLPAPLLNSLQIIHLTGRDEFANVQSAYKDINISVKPYPFFERMGLLYRAADFAICRAGATTIAELCTFAVPAILIPYTGAGAHQGQNAGFLKEKGAAVIIEENKLIPSAFEEVVVSLLRNRTKLSAMSRGANSLAGIDAAEKLAKVVLEI